MSPSTMQIGQARRAEMEALFQQHGTVTPRQVLEFAADENTALHSAFTWDDSEAATRFRIIEATRLIRRAFVVLQVPGANEERRVHMAVSLPADRGGVGYRLMSEVLSDPEQRDQLVRAAMRELNSFRKKFSGISELAEVFAAIENMQNTTAA